MTLTSERKKEIWKHYDTWMQAYLNADVETYDSYFHDDYHFIGSTDNEEFLKRKDTTEFFKVTGDQFAGLMDLRNESKTLEQFDELIFITHFCDVWFLNEDQWRYYGRFRLSSIMKQTDKGWRFIYQHFSMPDSKSDDGQSVGFENVKTENIELKEAIKRRTQELELKNRELEIESALDRIRVQATAMKKSSDLLDIVVTMRNEFIKLGHEAHYFWHMMWLPDTYEKAMTSGDGSRIGFVMRLPRHIHGNIPLIAKWEKSNRQTVIYAMTVDEAIDYIDKMVELGNFQNIDPQAPSHDDIRHINGLTFVMARTTHGEIGYSLPGVVKKVPKVDLDILIQFAAAFDLAHRRFLDLQKAEQQAREVEIELALEKVRSRTMAMQKSEELSEASFLLDTQVRELGMNTWGCAFNIYGEEESTEWFGNEKGELNTYKVPRIGVFKDYYDKGQQGETLFIKEYSGDECVEHYEFMSTLPGIGDILKQLKKTNNGFPTYQIDHVVYFKFGYLLFITREPVPDAYDVFKRFANVFEQTYTRFLDLQKAEAQAREAQIETSLEKVRSRTMAMQKGEEVKDVVVLLYKELLALGVTNFATCGYVEINEKTNRQETWVTNPGGDSLGLFYLPLTGDVHFDARYEAWKNKQTVFHQTVAGKERRKHLEYAITTFNSKEAEEMVRNQFPDPTVFYCFNFSHGYLHLVCGSQLNKDEESILARFTRVFEQTYARFLDLKKAEAQAREAQIEAALERVRSRSMAMHNSEELLDVISVVSEQLQQLDFKFVHVSFVDNDISENYKFWTASKNRPKPMRLNAPYKDIAVFNNLKKAQEQSASFCTDILTKKEHKQWHKHLLKNGGSKVFLKEENDYIMSRGMARSVSINPNIMLILANYASIPYSDDENKIIARFGQVFEQSYTRFLDLKKAEAQTREAQIEAALERVRSQSMGMQNSSDLGNVTTEMFNQLRNFGEDLFATGIVFCDKHTRHVEQWHSIPGGEMLNPFIVPIDLDYIHQYRYDQWKLRKELFSIEIPSDFIEQHFEDIFNLPSAQIALKDLESRNTPMPEAPPWEIDYGASFKNGYLLISSLKHLKNIDILPRFAKVFEQTYARFLDLQKAEAQARESQIEAALEKVRSRTMAMQHSEELPEAANNLFLQVQELGIPAWSAGYCIWEKDQKSALCHMSSEGEVQKAFSLPTIGEGYNFYDPYKKGETFHVSECGGKALVKHYDFMKKLPTVGAILEELEKAGLSLPTFQIFHIVFFKFGYVMFITYESVPDAHHIFKRFGQVFEQTYTRFLDLKLKEEQAVKLENEKRRLEKTLRDLQETQKQLIQSEKMASLGELTAGIAHEIQNPLNFVNNFSEVSKELLEEMQEEIENGDFEEVKAIMVDVIQNLDKINHHGKRADGIVKGMLQHSRASGDKKEPTDINALADEYLRLAYHGLRAKDKSFNAELVTDFDDSIESVMAVPQDVGRVILNLLTNAFYVVNEKKKINNPEYKPRVSISTKKKKGFIEVTVADNGNGMPESVKEKIFQPFFTTKPTGEGTGLGLSLSYDIITKGHGGDLKVETKENVGTTFIIQLPEI